MHKFQPGPNRVKTSCWFGELYKLIQWTYLKKFFFPLLHFFFRIFCKSVSHLMKTFSKSIPWYISTEENTYLCGGVNYEEDAAKEKRRRKKRNIPFPSPSFFLRSVLFVFNAPAEVIIFLSADIGWKATGVWMRIHPSKLKFFSNP